MSTMTPPQPPSRWIQKRLARLTVDQYEVMVDSGVFSKRDRFTLVNGFLVAKAPKSLRQRQGANRYGKPRIFKAGQLVPVVIEGVDVGRIAVADILPRDTSGHRPAAGGNGAQPDCDSFSSSCRLDQPSSLNLKSSPSGTKIPTST
jgi:hypothetical protein